MEKQVLLPWERYIQLTKNKITTENTTPENIRTSFNRIASEIDTQDILSKEKTETNEEQISSSSVNDSVNETNKSIQVNNSTSVSTDIPTETQQPTSDSSNIQEGRLQGVEVSNIQEKNNNRTPHNPKAKPKGIIKKPKNKRKQKWIHVKQY